MSKSSLSTIHGKLTRPPLHRERKDDKSLCIPKTSPKTLQEKKSVGKKKNQLYPNLDNIDDKQHTSSSESDDVEENIDGNIAEDSIPLRRNSREKSPGVGPRRRTNNDDNYDHNISENALIEDNEILDTMVEKSYILLVIFVIFIGIVLWFVHANEVVANIYLRNTNTEIIKYDVFKSHFEKIKENYPSQTRRFWQIIGASIKRVLTQTASRYPAVILIAVPKGQGATGTCISNDIVKTFNKVFNFNINAYINSTNLKLSYPDKAKVDLDDQLQYCLSYGKGVVLDYVNLLPAQCGLLLHGYCDGDNAPYKDVVILLTLHTDYKFQELSDSKVEDILTQMWEHDLGIDEMPALRSRIANNVAIVAPENIFICQ